MTKGRHPHSRCGCRPSARERGDSPGGCPVLQAGALADRQRDLAGDFSEVTLFTDRRGVMAEWAQNSGEDFEHNLVRLRVEGRFGVGVGQPAAVVQVATIA